MTKCHVQKLHPEIPSLTLLAIMLSVFEATCLPAQCSELIYWQLTQSW